MTDTKTEKPEEKKGLLGVLKEKVEDKEEQMAILSTFVRLGILVWAGGILTINYVQIPGFTQQEKIDPTFIASVFTGVLATFGVQAGQGKKNGANGSPNGPAPISKKDMEMLIERASQAAPTQTIKFEHAPLVITPQQPKKD
tara:strand:- start:317 stop:742 length:426 start_codon:yes stop_codon:yes gene_type:complete